VHGEKKPGRIIRRFDTGAREEPRLIADLTMTGASVSDRQKAVNLVGGHVRGKMDGLARNMIEAPKKTHVLETKALNKKRFTAVVRHGCRKAEPMHFAQCQLGMHAEGLERAAYFIENTDDDSLWLERIEYDIYYASSLVSRLLRIVESPKPPGRLCSNEDDHRGMFCKNKSVCFGGELLRHTCRSCIYSKAEMSGNAVWSCQLRERVITTEEQKAACPQHLNIPATVPGEQIDVDKEAGTITYRMEDDIIWTDGPEAF
jgi:hypothetical protein